MHPESVPAVVIGAGVVGCAVSEALTRRGIRPWVLERGPRISEGITSRNSGVIHAGIYYPPGSLKADCCIRGNRLLYEWCEKHRVPNRRTGKWIVGSADERVELEALYENARRSGASGLRWASPNELSVRIPAIKADAAIFSSETGIVDPYALSRSLQGVAEDRGAEFLLNTRVIGIERLAGGRFAIETSRGAIMADLIVNAAGLMSVEVARLAGIDRYQLYPCRGDYFRISSRFQFHELVYPIKKRGSPGLGIHLTVGLDGSCRLGPDAEYVSDPCDFGSRADKLEKFLVAGRQYLPGLRAEDLSYDTCGIRPKLRSPTDPQEVDFVISRDRPGLVNLVGIESPGLTSALAIAERVLQLL